MSAEAERDHGTVLELVAKRGRALVSARALIIELERGAELEVAAAAGEVPPGIVGSRIPFGGCVKVAIPALAARAIGNGLKVEMHSFGVLGMRERAELLLGTLEIQSAPGGPTVVRASLPASCCERLAPMPKAG